LNNSFFGRRSVFHVLAGAFAVGGSPAEPFNRLVLAPPPEACSPGSTLWVYIVVQAVAGIAAGLTSRAQP